MASSTETTASSSVGGVPPPRYPPPGLPPVDPALMDMLQAPTSENLLATASDSQGLLLFLASIKHDPWPPSSRCPPQEGMRQARRPLTSSRFICLDTPLGCERPPPRQAPPLVPVRVMIRWPEGAKTPEVGPHPEGLKAETGGIDLPPEDLGNADEPSIVKILWTMSLTMWPRAGSETSPT